MISVQVFVVVCIGSRVRGQDGLPSGQYGPLRVPAPCDGAVGAKRAPVAIPAGRPGNLATCPAVYTDTGYIARHDASTAL